ncbi:hypothetical protein LAZ40_06600 [Cereibacter sphaeroides]|uniref:hypothetical protein n=1 Tax=Cereibacter sphaeroides TaxID=1063 RepID=UPI001F411D2C|nr:hypothetical protein [Cereibacter sphaeroides]MCE6958715.1 hypothetical protein [Cereibacter sphaeroides]MCE6971203.1 hypothetical protein [Cereibacter sphaeroides]
MPLDLGDLDGKIKQFETAAAEWLARVSPDEEELDELVIDTLSEEASKAVNSGANSGDAHGEAEDLASGINNGGAGRQVAALLALGWTLGQLEERLEIAPSPEP